MIKVRMFIANLVLTLQGMDQWTVVHRALGICVLIYVKHVPATSEHIELYVSCAGSLSNMQVTSAMQVALHNLEVLGQVEALLREQSMRPGHVAGLDARIEKECVYRDMSSVFPSAVVKEPRQPPPPPSVALPRPLLPSRSVPESPSSPRKQVCRQVKWKASQTKVSRAGSMLCR